MIADEVERDVADYLGAVALSKEENIVSVANILCSLSTALSVTCDSI